MASGKKNAPGKDVVCTASEKSHMLQAGLIWEQVEAARQQECAGIHAQGLIREKTLTWEMGRTPWDSVVFRSRCTVTFLEFVDLAVQGSTSPSSMSR